ncbi:hypothetical protein AB0N09_05180 [Streptomyces erythrochromogenes]|uniref:hypothetical protein n=1 Tax=Streptomyces erythrochromogenes TaxID=285574 RepID=UPI00341A597B
MFDNHDDLNQELTNSRTWSALYATILDWTTLAAQTVPQEDITGLRFFEPTSRIQNAPIRGTVTVDPATGAMTLAADGFTGDAWFTALERLGSLTAPEDDRQRAWAWKPGDRTKPGTLAGGLSVPRHAWAETEIGTSKNAGETIAYAALRVTPESRKTCRHAWALVVSVLGTLATENPAFRSTILPAPDPTVLDADGTDYQAAVRTVADALALLDENTVFGHARDHDPRWPADDEGDAVRALRHFRDALAHTA